MVCPVIEISQILGKKWAVLVLEELSRNGPKQFNELKRSVMHLEDGRIKNVTQKPLSGILRLMEGAGLLETVVVRGDSVKTKYTLTKKGEEVSSIFSELKKISMTNGEVVRTCPHVNCNSCYSNSI